MANIEIFNEDCIQGMNRIQDKSVDLVLTDIPYGQVNRKSNGLRNLDKKDADIANFDVKELTTLMANKTKGSIYIFCGFSQLSTIFDTLVELGFSTRIVIWEKTNPSPMNGDKIWLSGIEVAVYGKRPKATYNLHCKNSVLRHPSGRSKIHPTQKPLTLFEDLIKASTNEGDTVLDPFMGSGTAGVASKNLNRNFIGFELNQEYFNTAKYRIENENK